MSELPRFQDPPAGEDAAIERMVALLSAQVERDYRRINVGRRDAHPKAHGVVHGTFAPHERAPTALRIGAFGGFEPLPAWIRFSNASERVRDDRAKDVRGMAIKVMGLDGAGLDGKPRTTQDFVLIDSPRFFLPDAVRYEQFFANRLRFALDPRHWRFLWIALRMMRAMRTPLDRPYFSAVPLCIGGYAVKLGAFPLDQPAPPETGACAHQIYQALHQHLLRRQFRFELRAQQYVDDRRTPIEDPTREWREPWHPIATLTIPAQAFSHPELVRFGEDLSFSPWSCLIEHAPLGGINRVRRRVYQAISELRHAKNGRAPAEPEPESVARLGRPPARELDPEVHAERRHGQLCVLARVRGDRVDDVDAILRTIDAQLPKGRAPRADGRGELALPLPRVASLHFARLVLVRPQGDLLLSCNHDGDEDAFLTELLDTCGDGLRALYDHCEGFDGELRAFMWARRQPALAFYVGAPGRTVARVRAEAELRARLQDFLDRDLASAGATDDPAALRARLQRFAFEEVSREWTYEPPPPLMNNRLARVLGGAAAGAAAVIGLATWAVGWPALAVALALVMLALGVWVWFVRTLERHDVDDDAVREELPWTFGHEEGPAPVQNWITHCVPLKPGPFRSWLLRTTMWVIQKLVDLRYNQGDLGGIRTIHFARWLLVPNPPRIVFFSNYGGTWEAYLDAFIHDAGRGLTAAWSHAINFPSTRPLYSYGAKDGPRFKRWTRYYQIHTHVWYSAYPALSVRNVNQNSAIRRGLYGSLEGKALRRWLALFGRAE